MEEKKYRFFLRLLLAIDAFLGEILFQPVKSCLSTDFHIVFIGFVTTMALIFLEKIYRLYEINKYEFDFSCFCMRLLKKIHFYKN
jgi:hypothetical protein